MSKPRETSLLLCAWMASAAACGSAGVAPMADAAADADSDGPGGADGDANAGWQSLFNGVDLTGWQRYLGEPSAGAAPLGLDNDPRGVYSVVTLDGEPTIRISGEVWGALISQDQFCNFHLRAQYRWGTATWPPLNSVDSGIMYLSTGALGAVNAGGDALSDPAGSGAFMVSMEYQLTPGDVGGIYNLGPIAYQRSTQAGPAELPGWNDVDIIVQAGAAQHLRNGGQVAAGSQFVLDLPGQTPAPLSCGQLQLQSEGAEIYFRRLTLMPLTP